MADFRGQRRGANSSAHGVDLTVTGADDLLALSRQLKNAGRITERKDFHRDLTRALKPIVPDLKEFIAENYPKGGGLAERTAKRRITPKLKTGAKTAGLSVALNGVTILLSENYGRLRHPVYADKSKTRKEWTWVNQVMPLGMIATFAKTRIQEYSPAISKAYRDAIERVLNGG